MAISRWDTLKSAVAAVIGIPLIAMGGYFLGVYLFGVVDIMINKPPDRSWLFWGIPVAFVGLIMLAAGVGLAMTAWRLRPGRQVGR